MRNTLAAVALTALTLPVLAGCGSDDPDAGPTRSPTPAARSSSASPSPSPSPTGPTLPPAADGTDVSACYDGSCEVRVRAPKNIPMAPKTGIARLTVQRITDDGVRVAGSTTSGTDIVITVYADPGGLAIGRVNQLEVAALGVVDGVAVIHLALA